MDEKSVTRELALTSIYPAWTGGSIRRRSEHQQQAFVSREQQQQQQQLSREPEYVLVFSSFVP